jgi:hypothetical protein
MWGKTLWEGMVHSVDLANHSKAKRAYTWSYQLPDSMRRFFAVCCTLARSIRLSRG